MKRAAEAEEVRNQITHSLWVAGENAETITRIKTTAKERRGIHFHYERVKAEDLAGIATQLKVLDSDIQLFWLGLLDEGKALNNPVQKIW